MSLLSRLVLSAAEIVKRTKHVEQTALTTCLIAACLALLFAAFAAHAQKTSAAQQKMPISTIK